MDILYINKVEEAQNDKNDFSKRSCKTMEHHRAESSGTLQSGRIEGTVRQGRSWQIPADASKPADKRIRSGSYRKNQRSSCLPLPIGVSDSGWHRRNITMLIRRC